MMRREGTASIAIPKAAVITAPKRKPPKTSVIQWAPR
jgi:hypothetical protein